MSTDATTELPIAFCWTKFAAEAGQESCAIIARKETERLNSGGVFLWGIGASVRSSILELLEVTDSPRVLFSPMLSPAAQADRSPAAVAVWTSASGIDGRHYAMPTGSVVTSRASVGRRRQRHYALVCRRESSLYGDRDLRWIDDASLRNLRSGNVIGASQVTSVVRVEAREARHRYRVQFAADLVAPYFLELTDPVIASAAAVYDAMAHSNGRDELLVNLDAVSHWREHRLVCG